MVKGKPKDECGELTLGFYGFHFCFPISLRVNPKYRHAVTESWATHCPCSTLHYSPLLGRNMTMKSLQCFLGDPVTDSGGDNAPEGVPPAHAQLSAGAWPTSRQPAGALQSVVRKGRESSVYVLHTHYFKQIITFL